MNNPKIEKNLKVRYKFMLNLLNWKFVNQLVSK